MSIDEAVAVSSSSNVDMRSFALNSDIGVVLYDRDATLIFKRIERQRLEQSVQLRASDWERLSLRESAQRTSGASSVPCCEMLEQFELTDPQLLLWQTDDAP